MTKHYVSSSEIPHLWAHQAQDWGKGGNLSFEGKTLKSYWLTIARIVDDCYGTPIAVILDNYDSHTTRNHIYMARRAVHNVLPNVTSIPNIHGELQHARNIAALLSAAKALATKALTCQPENVEWKLYPACQRLNEAKDYAIAFAIAEPDTTEFDAIVAKALERKNTAECAEHDKNAIARNQERIDLWRSGERVYLPLSGAALLRIDGSEIETSLGARFPIEHAKKAFPLIKACHDNSKAFTPNGHAVHLGHYQLSSVDSSGNVVAGCHRVAWTEIELMATQLGLE